MSRLQFVLSLATTVLLVPARGSAQADTLASTAYIHSQYVADLTAVHDKLLALADAIPADKYSWRPTPGVRSIAEVLMHVAGEWSYMCPISVADKPPPDFGAPGEAMRKLEQLKTKPEVLEQFKKSWTYCAGVLKATDLSRLVPQALPAKMPFARVVLLISGDQHEHLGQLITYARSVGVTPPWSK